MGYSDDRLNDIFEKTDGRCHLCHGTLVFSNYAEVGSRGAWEVEHSVPRAKGGTDHLNNLFAAHISCNRAKGANSTRATRAANGKTRAPRSREAQEKERNKAALTRGAAGAVVGGSLLGPAGAMIGAIVGSATAMDDDFS